MSARVILGPTPCAVCRRPVAWVERPLVVRCRCGVYHPDSTSSVLVERAWVDADGRRHECRQAVAA